LLAIYNHMSRVICVYNHFDSVIDDELVLTIERGSSL